MDPHPVNIIEAEENTPLFYQWNTGLPMPEPKTDHLVPIVKSDMRIVTSNGDKHQLVFGSGMNEGRIDELQQLAVSLHIWRPAVLGVGDHSYLLTVTDDNFKTLISEAGIIRVKPGGELKEVVRLQGMEPDVSSSEALLGSEYTVEPEIQEWRMKICSECPLYDAVQGICTDCGCYMPLKTRMQGAECPKNFWVV